MPKRLTDTNKWKDSWFRKLSPRLKLGFLYLLDECDHAGVIDLDRELADFQIGEAIDWDALIDGDRVLRLQCGKLWVVKFCQFQYSKGLKEASQIHNSVISELSKYGLLSRLPQGFVNPCQRIKDKDKDKDKDLEGVQGEIEVECLPSIVEQFAEIWNATPGVTVAATMSQRRVSALKARLAETINGRPWFEVLKEVCRTKFPLKMSASDTNGWKPDCDWILRPDSVLAIYEGKYDWRKDKRSDHGQDKTAAIAKSRADSLKSHAELQRTKAEAERVASESRKRAEALEAKFGASLDLLTSEEIRHLARSSLEDSEAAMLLKGYHGGPPGKLLRAALLESLSTAKAPA